ncbi:VWA domain-containing protein [Ktedonobacteria bacterium brp13]|nr:VWA domain-containing protein [Ktedonobacteria bacterium brp13]
MIASTRNHTHHDTSPKPYGQLAWPMRFSGKLISACLLLLVVLSGCAGSSSQKTTAQSSTPTATQNQGNQVPGSTNIQCTQHSSNPVQLNVLYSSEKQAWMEPVVAAFNKQHYNACDGPITVKATPAGSGASMQEILNGTSQPDVWSPAGNVWVTLINSQWNAKHGSNLIATGANDTPSLVSSPVVIAMWKPQAEALGWPQKAIGWSDIAKLSTDPQGWKTYGHPEFGDFKFGHTNPSTSNSGLDAVIAMTYASTNKTRGLTKADVASTQATSFLSNVESSVIHYGDSTGFFADKMFQNGPGYLSAAILYENLVVEANDGQTYKNLPYPVVAIYPKEGTFYSDHPYTVLQASWVTPAKQAAALAFRDFLLAPAQQQKALQEGFRPANNQVPITAPLDSAHGVDPSQPHTLLQVPSADIVNAIEDSWGQQKRRVDVTLILDRSGSMNDTIGGVSKIDGAKQGLQEFVKLLSNDDELGVTTFSDQEDVVSPISLLGPKRQNVLAGIAGINANGSTKLYDTIADVVQQVKSTPSKHIKAVIVLTDGEDTASTLKESQLIDKIKASGENAGNSVKVFTIAYGSAAGGDGPDKTILTQIANSTGGQEYAGNPQNIEAVYNQISLFF